MSTKRFRLTKASKILIMVLVIALIGGGVFAGLKTGIVKMNSGTKIDVKKSDSDGTINLSLDEWIG